MLKRSALSHARRATRARQLSNVTNPLRSAACITGSSKRHVDPLIRPFHSSAGCREVVKVPQMAESISEGTLKQWNKKKGDSVEADEEVAVIETDKIDVTVNAPSAGTITETFANEDDTVTVGQDLFNIEAGDGKSSGDSKPKEESKEDSKPPPKEEKSEEPKKQESSPKKEEASPKKEDESRRRKSESDQKYEKRESQPKRDEPQVTQAKQPTPEEGAKAREAASAKDDGAPKPGAQASGEGNRTERRVKLNRMRQRIAERLKQSQNTAASLTTFNEIDMTSIMEMRSLYKDAVLKEYGIKLGYMSAFARAAVLALQEIPAANASIEGPGAGEQIVYRDYVDLSVAVSTEKGLVTPVVRNAESMNFVEIEQEIARLGKKARDNKLTIEDMTGGTFTISNGGVFGSLFGTPIINLPQTCVLGMHATKEKPYVVNGEIKIRPIMVVALTYDHRLLDGREAVQTLVKIKNYIEDPRRLLLGV